MHKAVLHQSVAVVPEVIFLISTFDVHKCLFSATNNLIPQHHLIQRLNTKTLSKTAQLSNVCMYCNVPRISLEMYQEKSDVLSKRVTAVILALKQPEFPKRKLNILYGRFDVLTVLRTTFCSSQTLSGPTIFWPPSFFHTSRFLRSEQTWRVFSNPTFPRGGTGRQSWHLCFFGVFRRPPDFFNVCCSHSTPEPRSDMR